MVEEIDKEKASAQIGQVVAGVKDFIASVSPSTNGGSTAATEKKEPEDGKAAPAKDSKPSEVKLSEDQKNAISAVISEFMQSNDGKQVAAANPPLSKDDVSDKFKDWLIKQADMPTKNPAIQSLGKVFDDAGLSSDDPSVVRKTEALAVETKKYIEDQLAASIATEKGKSASTPEPKKEEAKGADKSAESKDGDKKDSPPEEKGFLGGIGEALGNNKGGLIGGIMAALIGFMMGGPMGAIIGLLLGGLIGGQSDQNGIMSHMGGGNQNMNPSAAKPFVKPGQEKTPEAEREYAYAFGKDGKPTSKMGSAEMLIRGHYDVDKNNKLIFQADGVALRSKGEFEYERSADNHINYKYKKFNGSLLANTDHSVNFNNSEGRAFIVHASEAADENIKAASFRSAPAKSKDVASRGAAYNNKGSGVGGNPSGETRDENHEHDTDDRGKPPIHKIAGDPENVRTAISQAQTAPDDVMGTLPAYDDKDKPLAGAGRDAEKDKPVGGNPFGGVGHGSNSLSGGGALANDGKPWAGDLGNLGGVGHGSSGNNLSGQETAQPAPAKHGKGAARPTTHRRGKHGR